MTHPTPLQRIAFLAALAVMAGCAPVKRCEFPLWVTVTPDADEECRALPNLSKWADDGRGIRDTDRVNGCAPKDRIITNGTDDNLAHEMRHQIERNCSK